MDFISTLQPLFLLYLLVAGFLCTFIFDITPFAKLKKFGKIFSAIILFFIYFVGYYTVVITAKLPSTRLYMPLCFLLGGFIEYKSLHKTIAILTNKVYNSIYYYVKKFFIFIVSSAKNLFLTIKTKLFKKNVKSNKSNKRRVYHDRRKS